MARIISCPDKKFVNFSDGVKISSTTYGACIKNQPLNGLPFKNKCNFRVSCSLTEREREKAAEAERRVNGLEVNDQKEVGSGNEEVGLGRSWPPWEKLPQRYKLIGATSLAFVVCNMDKVISLLLLWLFSVALLWSCLGTVTLLF